MDNGRKLTFSAQPVATMRRPIFQGNDDLQRAWNELWKARLEVFGCVMPWLREAINGIPEGANGANELQHQLAYLDARTQYEAGTRATKYVEQVKAIHERQNREWKELTGMEPLGTLDDWRAAAAAAGVPPAEFEKYGFSRLAKLISAWAIAKRANTTEPAKLNATTNETTTDNSRANTILAAVADEIGLRVIQIAGSTLQTNDKLRAIARLDAKYRGWTSDRLAELVGVKGGATVRATEWWRVDRKKDTCE